MTPPSLDDLIARACSADVRSDHVRSYVGELGRWARVEPPRRVWPAWLAGGLALTAAVAVAVAVARPRPDRAPATAPALPSEPTRIGARVAILAEPGTVYRVAEVAPDRTALVVDRGTVTARLWPGAAPHVLALRGGGVEAIAIGTVYALSVGDRGAVLRVYEGAVELRDGGGQRTVPAGAVWPPHEAAGDGQAARRLLVMAAPEVVHAEPDAMAPPDAPATSPAPPDAPATSPAPPDAAPVPAREPAAIEARIDARPDATPDATPDAMPTADGAPPADAVPPMLRDRWRQARLLRGQGKLDAALAECLAIADARDATWSPIALLEAARIQLGPMTDPDRAVALAERFGAEWPGHVLAPEARELRCRALRQLGHGAACAADAGVP